MKVIFSLVVLGILICNLDGAAYAQQPVLQRGYDSGLSGANLTETSLTTSNVNASTFGLKFSLPVDDQVYAQPLYVPKLAIAGGTHNVIYVATMSNSLYAFDADTGAQLWKANFTTNGGGLIPIDQFEFNNDGNDHNNINGNLGILSTPVIDPSTNILYLVAGTLENGSMVYRLHAVNITNGTEPLPSAVVSGSYKGATFNARYQTQRVSLVLVGNQVVFAFAAVELESSSTGYTGWVMAYNKQTLAQSGVFAAVAPGSTNASGGGIWQSGRAPAVDSAGNVYLFTGNGYNTGYNGSTAFSETVLKLNPANGLALVDWFTPSNWNTLDANDTDLSSSGPMLVPNTSPSLLVGGGKQGTLYVLDTTHLDKETATDSGAIQKEGISSGQIKGGPVYWQRSAANGGPLLYNWGVRDVVKAYGFNGTNISSGPTSQGSVSPVYPGGILALSANGDQPGSGVLWATAALSGQLYNDVTAPGWLYALDASDVSKVLYSVNYGNFAKFVPPVIANGKVYVATFSNQVAVYGLLASTPTAATPTFSPAPGTYTSPQQVTLSDATSGTVIHYTTDGSTPTASSPTYASGSTLSISTTETLQAIAVASGYVNSTVATGQYVISTPGSTVSVNLSSVVNVTGIGTLGTPPPNGGLDATGYAYAANLLGASLNWSGASFSFGAPNVADAVSSTTVPLPTASYSSIKLLAAGMYGNQVNQTFVITYADGTTTSFTQSLSDWWSPSGYAGESVALTLPYWLGPNGAQGTSAVDLYGYSFPLNSAKTVKSITLPNNRHVVVLAIDLIPGGTDVLDIDAGGPAAGSYLADKDFSGGSVASTTSAINTSLVASPAPQAVYQSERYGAFTYTIPNLTAGASYTVNLHFAEIYWGTAGQREFNVLINGIQVLTNFDIFAAAGGKNIAIIKSFPATASSSGTITLQFTNGAVDYAKISGIEIVQGTIVSSGTSVSLSTVANVNGIGALGAAPANGGLDNGGYAYATNLLGASLSWSGGSFSFDAPNAADAVSSATVTLPAGSYSNIKLLGAGVNGPQVNQTFLITYTDGTTASFTQSLSDWGRSAGYAGESIALSTSYRVGPNGAQGGGSWNLYGYSFPLNSAKTVKSITLPNNRNVVVLAVNLGAS